MPSRCGLRISLISLSNRGKSMISKSFITSDITVGKISKTFFRAPGSPVTSEYTSAPHTFFTLSILLKSFFTHTSCPDLATELEIT